MNDLNSLFQGLVPTITPQVAQALHTQIKAVPLALPLLDFQEEALEHVLRDSVNRPYAYLGLDMGLGKTAVALAIAKGAKHAGHGAICAVVPPSLRITWLREAAKFCPDLKAVILRGNPLPGETLPPADLYIIGDSSLAKPKYRAPDKKYGKPDPRDCLSPWALMLTDVISGVIVDEAHRFKNVSARSRALRALADPVPGLRVLMSGTPTPNGRHSELAAQISILGVKAWRDIGGEGMFWNHYAPMTDEYGGRGSVDPEGLFAAMSKSWYFRRLRDDVMDLPNKGRTAVAIESPEHGTTGLTGFSARAVRDYKRVEKDLINFLAQEGKLKGDGWGQKRAEAMIKLTLMRKLIGQAKVVGIVEHVREILAEEPGGVFLVAEHRDVMDELETGLIRFNPTTVQGGMSDKDKQENIDAFVKGDSRVMIGQIIAAGTGLTLHGGGINRRVVVAQLPWTPADLKQAEDRLHRIGQTKDVMVEICLGAIPHILSVDERLWNLLEKKNVNSGKITDGYGEFLLQDVQDGLLDSYR